jgi:hypothetical protein
VKKAVGHFKDSRKILGGLQKINAPEGVIASVSQVLKVILQAIEKRKAEQVSSKNASPPSY